MAAIPRPEYNPEQMSKAELAPVSPVAHSGMWHELLVALPFLCFVLLQLVHHQFWRDELNAWAIAVASPTLKQLFTYIHYEAHPGLWYVLLWIVSRFTHSPLGMKALEALVATAIYATIALTAPFSRREKLLLYAGYFVSFEYTVMSRMYGVLFLLVLLYAHQRAKHPNRTYMHALLLGGMANSDTLGVLLSGALILEYLVWRWPVLRSSTGREEMKRLGGAALLYLALLAVALGTLMPSKHISWRTTGHMFAFAGSLSHFRTSVLCYLVYPWLPIDWSYPAHFWNPILIYGPWKPFYWSMALIIPAMLLALFRRDRRLLFLVVATMTIAILFAHFIYLGSTRQFGITFMAFLVALWLQRYVRPTVPALSFVFLGLSALAGVEAAVGQWLHPFSNAGATAKWIASQPVRNEPLIGTKDTSTAGVAEEMQRPIYFLECNCRDTFILFSDRRDQYDIEQLPDRLALAVRQLHAPEDVFVDTDRLTPEQISALRERSVDVEPLAEFTKAEVTEEDFYLYKVRPLPQSGPPVAIHSTGVTDPGRPGLRRG